MSKVITISGYVSAAVTVRVPDDFDPTHAHESGPYFDIADQIDEQLGGYIRDNLDWCLSPDRFEVEPASDDSEIDIDFTEEDS